MPDSDNLPAAPARPLPGSRKRRLPIRAAVLVLVVTLGALLRVDALVQRYGPFEGPPWLRALDEVAVLAAPLRPPGFVWPHEPRPYIGGDPINYLRFAREMRGFYQGHVREPAFLALTRFWLWLTHGLDISVSLASLSASVAALLAVRALGAAAGSPWVGLLAAATLAVDYDAVSWAPEGWRDDLFMFTVTLAVWTLLRLRQVPTRARGIAAGSAAALACLTRITAVSFLVPALAWLVIDGPGGSRGQRLRAAAAAVAVATALVAPYLINTARATGDPFAALNSHTRYYRAAEGLPADAPQSAAAYLRSKIATHPVAVADTAVTGLLVLPVRNKGAGFGRWWGPLPFLLHLAMVAGLFLWLWTPDGRLLAVAALTLLVPYAVTWNLGGGAEWRFTMPVYPLLLVAAAGAVRAVWRLVLPATAPPIAPRRWPARWQIAVTVGVLGLATGAAVLYRHLPFLVAREAIAAGESTTIGAGPRDAVFFQRGWLPARTDGNVTARVSDGARATLHVPLPSGRPYGLVFRLDPVTPSAPTQIAVLLNRRLVGHLDLRWDPERVGAYTLPLPAGLVGRGDNDLELVADAAIPAGDAEPRYAFLPPTRPIAFRLWHLRIVPGTAGGS